MSLAAPAGSSRHGPPSPGPALAPADLAAAPVGTAPPGAGAVLAIDLDAIAANWRALRDRHAARRIAGVVKADAYGLGAAQVAPRLAAEGCRHFFVAHLAEAVALGPLLPADAMLAVLNGLMAGSTAEFRAHGLVPVLNDLAEIEAWANAARAAGTALPAILHIDTGMSRLGLDARSLERLAQDPSRLDGLDLRFVMSHLARSEEDVPMNPAQLARFRAACARLPRAPQSLANSSGLFLGPDYHFDLGRPGAATYGINPKPGHANPMRTTVRLLGRVLQVREIGAGESVGYGATFVAARPSRIATVAVGYADGYLRSLSARARAVIAGRAVPLVGRVSMDLITLDVTDLPEADAHAGAWAELIGPKEPPDAIAERAGTNGYEILTSLGARYHRQYLGRHPGQPAGEVR
ncbi:MAG: alanine racemase [Alphaproteobacteria bacterium]|nr:alanine racemase [Alphaproteobacteria bacterium]